MLTQEGLKLFKLLFNNKISKKIIKIWQSKTCNCDQCICPHASLGDVIEAIYKSLDNNGYFIFENHYMVDILKYNQYDTIYHEHKKLFFKITCLLI